LGALGRLIDNKKKGVILVAVNFVAIEMFFNNYTILVVK
jgi:hypothetical protein